MERVNYPTLISFRVQPCQAGMRLDEILAARVNFSRRETRMLVKQGRIRIQYRAEMGGCPRLAAGDFLEVLDATAQPQYLPENIPLEILHEEAELIFINKPSGMPVYPGPGHPAGTLANALRGLGRPLSELEGPLRPGIIHRLDVGTSGVMVIAKSTNAHRQLNSIFLEHKIFRRYWAIARGTPDWDEQVVAVNLGKKREGRKAFAVTAEGKHSSTHFKVLERYRQHFLVEAVPATGRTHQIRIHLQYLGHPVCGDTLYGGGSQSRKRAAALGLRRLGLHALELSCAEYGFSVFAPVPICFLQSKDVL